MDSYPITDVEKLISRLTNCLAFVQVMDPSVSVWNHVDFIWSINAAKEIYGKIIDFFGKN